MNLKSILCQSSICLYSVVLLIGLLQHPLQAGVPVPEEYVSSATNPVKGEDLTKKFLSYVYQCEGGNGNSTTTDGYTYRGHGAIQLTWKKTYQAFDAWLKANYKPKYKDVVANPKAIDEDKELFVLSAMWFWEINDLNKLSDDNNVKSITFKINSGNENLVKREYYVNQIKNNLK